MSRRAIGACVVVLGLSVVVCQTRGADVRADLRYGGPTACSAESCHGSAKPNRDGRTIHNEYTGWTGSKHALSFENLASDRAKSIAAAMKLDAPPQENGRCLRCHSLLVPKEKQQATYDLSAGNSCENCHGPSEQWLDQHSRGAQSGWSRARSLAAGMNDTQDLAVRAAICVRCHLAIDHDMLQGGHPFLGFELDNFAERMPPHWIQEKAFTGSKAWAAGQAAALRAALKQLDLRVKAAAPLQYIGDAVAVTNAYYTMLKHAAPRLAPEQWAPVDKELGWLSKGESPDRATLERLAGDDFQKTVFALAEALGAHKYDAETNLAIMKELSKIGPEIEYGGYRAAEQTYYAFDSLLRPYEAAARPANGAKVRATLDKLQKAIVPPPSAAWSAESFLATLKELEAELAK